MKLLKRGMRGSTVRFLQERLLRHGYAVEVDAIFGKNTRRAVEQFQAAQNLEVDGLVGDRTWDALLVERRAQPPRDLEQSAKDDLKSQARKQRKVLGKHAETVMPVLELAIDQLGLREQPNGSNGGRELRHIVDDGGNGKPPSAYYLRRGVKDPAVLAKMPPWCAIYISWALRDGLGVKSWDAIPFGEWFGAADEIRRWGKRKKCFVEASGEVAPGTIFVMTRGGSGSDAASAPRAGHTGFVVADLGTRVLTVEGNISNRVASRRRPKSSLIGFVEWWRA